MRFRTVLGVTLFLSVSLSCGEDADSPLSIAVKPDTSFILPGTHNSGCYQAETPANRLFYPHMQITWAPNKGRFYPAIMKIRFKGSQIGGEFECIIEENIPFLFKDSNGVQVTTNYLDAGTYDLMNNCAIECGGIGVTAENTSFKLSGELKMIGYAIKGEEQTPYSARTTIFMQNLN